jgi:hypothetical protein
MSEAIRRHDLVAAGGRVVSTEVSGDTITAVVAYLEESALTRARGRLVNRGWTVVKRSGLTIKVSAKIR